MKRQAIVLIHGIGEQKPMGTVRAFVKAILGDGTLENPTYWSKPDRMSQSFELRRLRSRGRTLAADFYEYYWAYNLQGTKLRDVLGWFKGLLLRRAKDVPPSARSLWFLSRLLVVSAAAGAGALALGWGSEWKDLFKALQKLSAISLVASGLMLLIESVVINYVGDAARYLSPLPRNIRLRQKIRGEGIQLLRALHASGKYDRIIVVGHSLGSVIAYDAITHLWQEFNEELPGLSDELIKQYVLRRMAESKSPQPVIRDDLPARAASLAKDGLDDFRRAQVAAWREQRFFGNGWLITDLVTIGSPLTHAMMLLAESKQEFDARQRERELPTCPPQTDKGRFAYSAHEKTVNVSDKRRFTPLVLHHAAPFAVTRWTNLYFPAALGLFGDPVGGPLRQHFGLGIKDVPVSSSLFFGLGQYTPIAHTSYWQMQDAKNHAAASRNKTAKNGAVGGQARRKRRLTRTPSLLALRQALALNRLRDFTGPGVSPTPVTVPPAAPMPPRAQPADQLDSEPAER
jgi:hypothetical protein